MTATLRNLMLALVATLALLACKKEEAAPPPPVVLTVPSDPADLAGWKLYLTGVVKANMEGIRQRPYMYFVPAVVDEETERQYKDQLETIQDTLGRGILPGNLIAFGSPDSNKLAELVVEAFKSSAAGSLKGVRVLVVGASADQERVKAAVVPSEAEFVFVEAR